MNFSFCGIIEGVSEEYNKRDNGKPSYWAIIKFSASLGEKYERDFGNEHNIKIPISSKQYSIFKNKFEDKNNKENLIKGTLEVKLNNPIDCSILY